MTGQQLQRLAPALPASAMKTFQVAAPIRTHHRPAWCSEAGCGHYLSGFALTVDEGTDLGGRQAHFVREMSGRKFTEERTPAGLTVFAFPAGQECFETPCQCTPGRAHRHHVRLEREERFLITGGDWRGNPRGERPVELSADSWLDDFGAHQDNLAAALERG